MTISYNGGVPAANNDPSMDQPDMLLNAQALAAIWARNHIGFNTAESGAHNIVDFPFAQTADPVIIPPSDQGSVYTKIISGATQLFFANSAGNQQLSFDGLSSSGNNFGFKLGNGIIVNCGLTPSISMGSGVTVNFQIPFTTRFISCSATSFDQDGQVNVSASPGNGSPFDLQQIRVWARSLVTHTPVPAWYIAIGT